MGPQGKIGKPVYQGTRFQHEVRDEESRVDGEPFLPSLLEGNLENPIVSHVNIKGSYDGAKAASEAFGVTED